MFMNAMGQKVKREQICPTCLEIPWDKSEEKANLSHMFGNTVGQK